MRKVIPYARYIYLLCPECVKPYVHELIDNRNRWSFYEQNLFTTSYVLMKTGNRPNHMKEFLDKFFDLCKEYQQEIPPHKMAEILRDYADRLD